MKLLIVVSSLDLRQPYSATPAWWQLLKGLAETGAELIVAPYQGEQQDSLWWQSEKNPAHWHGEFFRRGRTLWRMFAPPRLPEEKKPVPSRDAQQAPAETLSDRLTRTMAQALIAPIWAKHLDRLLQKHQGIQAILFVSVPPNHLRGVATQIHRKHGIPVLFYDGDMPASLPEMSGFATGFRIYDGADLAEFNAVISNSSGSEGALQRLGAKAVHTLWYGVDSSLYPPVRSEPQDIDVFFYGHGREYRSRWVDALLTEPSLRLPQRRFAVRGSQLGELGRTETLPYASFSALRGYIGRSKVNLCITRQAHANVYGSSSMRPFELASMGCCVVANPYLGLEEWFEPEREMIVIHSAEEAIERFESLLANESQRKSLGQAARARVLKQHTMRHRAEELLAILRRYR